MDKDEVYTHNEILLSYKKKKEILPFVTTWVNLEGIIPSQISQKRQICYYFPYMCYLKNKHHKAETDSETQRSNWCFPGVVYKTGEGD